LTGVCEKDKRISLYFAVMPEFMKETDHEENISAEPHQAQADARISRAHEHGRGPGYLEAQARQGA
jgi:hypothetical protein